MGNTRSFAPGTPAWIDYGTTAGTTPAARFYCGLFGWRVLARHRPIDDGAGYWVFQHDGKDIGGLGPDQSSAWTFYVSVPDIDTTAQAVTRNGGERVMGPIDIYDAGRLCIARDPAGARFAFWEPETHTGFDTGDEANAFTWSELACRDIEEAKRFYKAVFGWEAETSPFAPGSSYTDFSAPGVEQRVAGMVQMNDQWPEDLPAHWMVYFAVDDTDAMAARAAKLGGTVAIAPFDLAGRGRIAVLNDPEGGYFSIVQPPPS